MAEAAFDNVRRCESRQRAHEALDRLLDEILTPGREGNFDLRLVVRAGGVLDVRFLRDEKGRHW